ncbi:MAG: hypothetical protein HOP19_04700 [Acidobacteria bacterium]|nr:hypothetical protein [Acidobacteriota bacterium]
MIELTIEQRQAVAQQAESPLRALDPDTFTTYILVREELYNRIRNLVDKTENLEFLNGMHPEVMEVFGREGWDDPAMDIYNELDPRRKA